MNERITELYLHAFPPSLNDSALVQLSAEKFAELIVKECASQLNRRGVEGFGILEERNLLEHFGVE